MITSRSGYLSKCPERYAIGASVLWTCAACGGKSARSWDACPKCGVWYSCVRGEFGSGKNNAKPKRVSLSSYQAAPIARLPVPEPWTVLSPPATSADLAGQPPGIARNSGILVYGRGGTGKTTELLRLAASVPGAVFVAREPGQGPAELRALAARLELDISRLDVIGPEPLDVTAAALADPPAPLVVVDSIGAFDAPALEAWRRLRAAAPGAILVAIAHVTKAGRMAGREELAHEVDTIVEITRTRLRVARKNRFGPTPVSAPRSQAPR